VIRDSRRRQSLAFSTPDTHTAVMRTVSLTD
jgi:hypothetical protein